MVGRVLGGRYAVEARVGAGGMATVYRGLDTLLDRPVALKVLRAQLAADPDFVRRFGREARAAASLSHPCIIAVYDVGSDGENCHYIVQEFVDGSTLKERIAAQGPLPPTQVLRIMRQVLDALGYAHRVGLVHRDVKPQNVLLTGDVRVKVTDFGIALAESASAERSYSIVGTAHYAAPEQVAGRNTDERTDLYAAGVMMFEMLTGTLPFPGDATVAVAVQQLTREAPDPAAAAALPAGFSEVVTKAMRKAPEQRYRSAREFREDIDALAEGGSPPHGSADDAGRRAAAGARARPQGQTPRSADARTSARVTTPSGVQDGRRSGRDRVQPPMPRVGTLPAADGRTVDLRRPAGADRLRAPGAAAVAFRSDGTDPEGPPGRPNAAPSSPLVLGAAVSPQGVDAAVATYEAGGQAVVDLEPDRDAEWGLDADPGAEFAGESGEAPAAPERPRRYTGYVVAAAAVVVAAAGLLGWRVISGLGGGGGQVAVPNLVGAAELTAESRLLSLDLLWHVSKQTSLLPAGDVVVTSPPSDTSVRPRTTVDLWVSSGPPPILIPDMGGLSEREAGIELRGMGLHVRVAAGKTYSATVPAGYVVSSQPAFGAKVPTGGRVVLAVSSGPPPPDNMPDYVGQSENAVLTDMARRRLQLGGVQGEMTGWPAGIVAATTPVAGVAVKAGAVVDLTVSAGCLYTTPLVLQAGPPTSGNAGSGPQLMREVVMVQDVGETQSRVIFNMNVVAGHGFTVHLCWASSQGAAWTWTENGAVVRSGQVGANAIPGVIGVTTQGSGQTTGSPTVNPTSGDGGPSGVAATTSTAGPPTGGAGPP